MEAQQKKSSGGFGPGPKLAQARQDLGLTHEDVAKRLHLAERQIAALEADDYDSLPGPTYVRGYLRSYAELVGLACGPILEAYAHIPVKPNAASLSSLAPKEEVTIRHRHFQLATYAVVAIIIALAASWWQGREPAKNTVGVPDAASLQPSAPAQLVPDTLSAPVTRTLPTPGAQFDAARARMSEPTVTTPAPVPAPIFRTSPLNQPEVAVETRPRAVVPTRAEPAVVAPAPASTTVTAIHTALPPAGPRARLVLQTSQDSWVDVRDADDNKLLYETVPAGRVITLDGSAPLSVFLGNVDGVKVEFDGKPFDASPYKRGQIARFTLGAADTGH
ncbi:MAG: RodZ domain-containing protein [Acidiferrobacterales bacterium]